MKTSFFKSHKILVLLMLLALMICAIVLGACSKKEEKNAVEKYGESKAYIKVGGIDYVLADSTINFYIASSVSGDYKRAVDNAIAKANAVSSKITVTSAGSSTSRFVIEVKKVSSNGSNIAGEASSISNSSNQRIGSTVKLYTDALGSRSFEYKAHTALHEIGHVFGLEHIVADSMKGYTVMIAPHPSEKKYQLVDYAEFDKYNITWKYGE